MGVDEYLTQAECGAEVVDCCTIVPERSCTYEADCPAKILDCQGQLLQNGAVQTVKKADVSIAGPAADRSSQVFSYRSALWGSAVTDVIGRCKVLEELGCVLNRIGGEA